MQDTVPRFFWERYENDKDALKVREHAISTDAEYSYLYARDVLGGRFELGEPAISTNAADAYKYAQNVLEGRFEVGEEAIAKDPEYSALYAKYVLDADFYFNGVLIAAL